MKNLAIIPARGGSKRIPRKNIKNFCGKPIIAYSIEAALEAGLFDEIMVSTDDEEIAEVAKKYGASVPFMRSAENSNDYAGLVEVILEVLETYESKLGKTFDNICCVLATAPFVTEELLAGAYDKLKENNAASVFPIVKHSAPILRSLKKIENDKVVMSWPEYYSARSQDLEDAYYDAGLFYWANVEKFTSYEKMFTDNSIGVEISSRIAQDIDTEEDWEMAEFKFEYFKTHG